MDFVGLFWCCAVSSDYEVLLLQPHQVYVADYKTQKY